MKKECRFNHDVMAKECLDKGLSGVCPACNLHFPTLVEDIKGPTYQYVVFDELSSDISFGDYLEKSRKITS